MGRAITVILLLVLAVTEVPSAPNPALCQPTSGSQLFPCAVTRYSTPLKVSAAVGVVLMHRTGYQTYRGPFALLEPGFGGGKVSLGYRFGRHQVIPLYNLGAALSLMQTWGNPLGDVEGGQTYLGIELVGAFTMLSVNGGVFWHVAGDDEDHGRVWTLGVGAGI
jgi:hypothetical protein